MVQIFKQLKWERLLSWRTSTYILGLLQIYSSPAFLSTIYYLSGSLESDPNTKCNVLEL